MLAVIELCDVHQPSLRVHAGVRGKVRVSVAGGGPPPDVVGGHCG